jgi:hypothetical protein
LRRCAELDFPQQLGGPGLEGVEARVVGCADESCIYPKSCERPKKITKLNKKVVSESVQVETAATMVETRSTGVGQVVNQQQVLESPLNGRQLTQLMVAGASNFVQSGFGQAPSSSNLISSKNYPNEPLVSVAGAC